MPMTGRFYGGSTMGGGNTVQDFGLCDTKGIYQSTSKLRPKGLLVVVFFTTNSANSVAVLKAVQSWADELKTDKWTPLAVANADHAELTKFAETNGLAGVTFLSDYEYYQTRSWGVSHVPTLFVVAGKTGQALRKIVGDDATELGATKELLAVEIAKIIAAEEAAKAAAAKAAEEKAAADVKAAQAKAAEEPKPQASSPATDARPAAGVRIVEPAPSSDTKAETPKDVEAAKVVASAVEGNPAVPKPAEDVVAAETKKSKA